MVNLKQLPDSSMGLEGSAQGTGEFVHVHMRYDANSVTVPVYIASRPMIVQAIIGRVEVAGTDAGAVTAVIKKAASGTAAGSGTTLHSGTYNLKGTAATNQTLTLSTTSGVVNLAAGDAICFVPTGTLTSAVGCISIHMNPA